VISNRFRRERKKEKNWKKEILEEKKRNYHEDHGELVGVGNLDYDPGRQRLSG